MQAQLKGQVKTIFCAFMAFLLAFGLSILPSTAKADSPVDLGGISISGVDFMQPDAKGWELLKVDNLGDKAVFISVIGPNGKPLSAPQKFTATDSNSDQIAELICLQIPKSASSVDADSENTVQASGPTSNALTANEAFGAFGSGKTYKVEVSDAFKQGNTKTWTVYPVYAEVKDNDGSDPDYVLIGVRTAENTSPTAFDISDSYYKQDEGSAYPTTYILQDQGGTNCRFENNAFVATYKEPKPGEDFVTGKIRYVDLDGNLITEDSVSGITKEGVPAVVRQSFEKQTDENGDTVYYRTISSLEKVMLSYANSSYTVTVVPVTFNEDDAYPVTIKYVDQKGNLLWSDQVDVLGKGYRYTLPNLFSIAKENVINNENKALAELVEGINVYELVSVDGGKVVDAGDSNGTAVNLTKNLTNNDFVMAGEDGTERTVVATYKPMKEEVQVELHIAEINGATGEQIGEDIVEIVTPDTSVTYVPSNKEIDGKTYVPWVANADPIEYSWASLAKGQDLKQYVYYIPEDYVPEEPREITIQYVDVRNTSVPLKTQTFTIDPDSTSFFEFVGDQTFTQDGSTYVRLDGQSSGIRHAYYSPNDTYTIYYRNVNDTINANSVVTRTQIIDTVVPGTGGGITAAPALTDDAAAGDPDVEAGIGEGDGTVLINDDNNPLANLNGQDTTTERTIAENENPLASAGGLAQNPLAIAGIVAGVIALIAIAAFVIYRRRKNTSDKQSA